MTKRRKSQDIQGETVAPARMALVKTDTLRKEECDVEGQGEQDGVFMINVITVPDEGSEEFLEHWDRITEYMRRQRGFVRTNLYRRFDDPLQWVNVSVFESTESIRAAFSTEEFDRLAESHPGYRDIGLYAQIRSVEHL